MPATVTRPDVLTSCQEAALDKLNREGNIFLTGAAGTGKSYLLEKYLFGKSTMSFPVVASTGAAAVLIGGRTFHSFFGLGIMEGGIEASIARAANNRKLINRLLSAQCVVIDEISMLSGMTLYAADRISRKVRNRDEPWGGLRIIAVGDFAQLPPVTLGGQAKDWAFLHQTWEDSDFHPALLSTVMRTQDIDFLTILNYVRSGTVNDQVRDFLNNRMHPENRQEDGTRLYAHRAKAESYNLLRLEELPTRTYSFTTQYEGDERYIDTAKRAMPVPDELHLKEGALVMMRKNDMSFEQLYVNGSLGIVRQIDEEALHIRLLTGVTIEVKKEKFTYLDGDGKEILAAWNFPVTLAWATTIHKAQGASLDCMTVDLSALWEPGQAYVALSRVRSAAGLSIERWSESGIRAEPLVTDLYNSLAVASSNYVPRPLFAIRQLEEELPAKKKASGLSAGKQGPRVKRGAMIRELLAKASSMDEMIAACGIQADRVILYIEELVKSGKPVSIRYLIENIPQAQNIRGAFENCGTERLKPVFDFFDGQIPYTTLRLVRCVMMAETLV